MWDVLMILLGYCICVLFPMPFLSSAILRGWQAIGARLRGG